MTVGGAQNVTATISPGAVLALKSDIEDHAAADPAHPASKIRFDNAAAGLEGDPTRVQAALEALSARTLEPLAVSRQLYVATTGRPPPDAGAVGGCGARFHRRAGRGNRQDLRDAAAQGGISGAGEVEATTSLARR